MGIPRFVLAYFLKEMDPSAIFVEEFCISAIHHRKRTNPKIDKCPITFSLVKLSETPQIQRNPSEKLLRQLCSVYF